MALFDFFRRKNSKFPCERFLGSLYGYIYCILETRDPNYDNYKDDMKNKDIMILSLMAVNFLTPYESDTLNKLLDVIKAKKKSGNDRLAMFGSLEGKSLVYAKMSADLLLKDIEIKSK